MHHTLKRGERSEFIIELRDKNQRKRRQYVLSTSIHVDWLVEQKYRRFRSISSS